MAGFDNQVMFASNVDFSGDSSPSAKVTTNGQLLIGSTSAPNIQVGTLSSPRSTLSIGYSTPNLTADLITPVSPTNGGDKFLQCRRYSLWLCIEYVERVANSDYSRPVFKL